MRSHKNFLKKFLCNAPANKIFQRAEKEANKLLQLLHFFHKAAYPVEIGGPGCSKYAIITSRVMSISTPN